MTEKKVRMIILLYHMKAYDRETCCFLIFVYVISVLLDLHDYFMIHGFVDLVSINIFEVFSLP